MYVSAYISIMYIYTHKYQYVCISVYQIYIYDTFIYLNTHTDTP